MAIQDKDLASGFTAAGSYSPTQLFAGDKEVVTDDGYVVKAGQGELVKYTVVAIETATGKLVAHNPGGTGGAQTAIGILTQAVNAGGSDVKVAIYKSGVFNHEALTWHASLTTLAARKAVFERTPIQIGSVRL